MESQASSEAGPQNVTRRLPFDAMVALNAARDELVDAHGVQKGPTLDSKLWEKNGRRRDLISRGRKRRKGQGEAMAPLAILVELCNF